METDSYLFGWYETGCWEYTRDKAIEAVLSGDSRVAFVQQ